MGSPRTDTPRVDAVTDQARADLALALDAARNDPDPGVVMFVLELLVRLDRLRGSASA